MGLMSSGCPGGDEGFTRGTRGGGGAAVRIFPFGVSPDCALLLLLVLFLLVFTERPLFTWFSSTTGAYLHNESSVHNVYTRRNFLLFVEVNLQITIHCNPLQNFADSILSFLRYAGEEF